MSKSQRKKQSILEAGLEVMKAKGYNGTSVKDIVDAACIPKGSFYNYFSSKEAFAVEAIRSTACVELEQTKAALNETQEEPLERLIAFFRLRAAQYSDFNYEMGCFLGNMCQEMADSSEDIRSVLCEVLGEQTAVVESVLQEAKERGQLEADMDTAVAAEFLFNAWEGALMRMKAAKSARPLEAFIAQLRWSIDRP